MSPADIIILAVVTALFALCVRSFVRSEKRGECADCSAGASCAAHGGKGCELGDDIVARAAAAADACAKAHPTK